MEHEADLLGEQQGLLLTAIDEKILIEVFSSLKMEKSGYNLTADVSDEESSWRSERDCAEAVVLSVAYGCYV